MTEEISADYVSARLNIEWPDGTPKYSHTQVPANHPSGLTIHVDEGLKDLLEALWRQDFVTEWSCQGGLAQGTMSHQVGIAPASMFWPHGVTTKAVRAFSDASIVFADYDAAARFTKHTAVRLWTPEESPLWDIVLKPFSPYPDNAPWRAEVLWQHQLTQRITEAWR
jgi:hypothetical protein